VKVDETLKRKYTMLSWTSGCDVPRQGRGVRPVGCKRAYTGADDVDDRTAQGRQGGSVAVDTGVPISRWAIDETIHYAKQS